MTNWHQTQGRADAEERKRAAGDYVKMLREAAGLTQLEVAKAIGLDYYTLVSQVENGKARLPPERIDQWASALGADRKAFAKRLLQYYDPFTWAAIFGQTKGRAGDRSSSYTV